VLQYANGALQADKEDLVAFEAQSAAQRNDALFFKQLYKGGEGTGKKDASSLGPAKGAGTGGSGGSNEGALLDASEVQQLRQNIQQPAVEEVHSPLRLYVSTYLTFVLLAVVASGGCALVLWVQLNWSTHTGRFVASMQTNWCTLHSWRAHPFGAQAMHCACLQFTCDAFVSGRVHVCTPCRCGGWESQFDA
jgi:hypothetical protein